MHSEGIFVTLVHSWSGMYSPVFPQTGPPTERSGYVHLEGLHTGLIRDAVTARRKRNYIILVISLNTSTYM